MGNSPRHNSLLKTRGSPYIIPPFIGTCLQLQWVSRLPLYKWKGVKILSIWIWINNDNRLSSFFFLTLSIGVGSLPLLWGSGAPECVCMCGCVCMYMQAWHHACDLLLFFFFFLISHAADWTTRWWMCECDSLPWRSLSKAAEPANQRLCRVDCHPLYIAAKKHYSVFMNHNGAGYQLAQQRVRMGC